MSSLSAFHPAFRLNLTRVAVVGTLAALLALLGFFVPFWIVLIVAAGIAGGVAAGRAVRRANDTLDRILAEELGSPSTQ